MQCGDIRKYTYMGYVKCIMTYENNHLILKTFQSKIPSRLYKYYI